MPSQTGTEIEPPVTAMVPVVFRNLGMPFNFFRTLTPLPMHENVQHIVPAPPQAPTQVITAVASPPATGGLLNASRLSALCNQEQEVAPMPLEYRRMNAALKENIRKRLKGKQPHKQGQPEHEADIDNVAPTPKTKPKNPTSATKTGAKRARPSSDNDDIKAEFNKLPKIEADLKTLTIQ